MAAIRAIPITYCPPMPASGYTEPTPVFGDHRANPASAETGLSFADYNFAQTEVHKLNRGRRKDPPSWAFCKAEFRLLLARYCELRADITFPMTGTTEERVAYATHVAREKIPAKMKVLEKICREYTELKKRGENFPRQRKLEQLIEGVDSQIVLDRRGPAFVVAAIYQYFSLGWDSVQVAAALQLKPPCIRQLIFRLERLWKQMQDGTDAKPKQAKSETPRCRQKRRLQVVLASGLSKNDYNLAAQKRRSAKFRAKRRPKLPQFDKSVVTVTRTMNDSSGKSACKGVTCPSVRVSGLRRFSTLCLFGGIAPA